MAQLVARLNGIQKVMGSNPISSTNVWLRMGFFACFQPFFMFFADFVFLSLRFWGQILNFGQLIAYFCRFAHKELVWQVYISVKTKFD